MMAIESVIHYCKRALEVHLVRWPKVPTNSSGTKLIQYPAKRFTPPEDLKYLRIQHQINPSGDRTFGETPRTALSGLFIIDVFGPSGSGTKYADQLADEVMIWFKSQQTLSHHGTNVRLWTPSVLPVIEGSTWIFIPVHCPWKSRTSKL